MCSADHTDAGKSHKVLDIPGLKEFKLTFLFNWNHHNKFGEIVYGIDLQLANPFSFEYPTSSVFFELRPHEKLVIQPGQEICIGSLRFLVERFNMGVIWKQGNRPHMEDIYVCHQDFGLDS